MEALSDKIVLLVTHQVDFLPAFDSVLVSLLPILRNLMFACISIHYYYFLKFLVIIFFNSTQ